MGWLPKIKKGLNVYNLQDCIFKLLTDSFSNRSKGRLILGRVGGRTGQSGLETKRMKNCGKHFPYFFASYKDSQYYNVLPTFPVVSKLIGLTSEEQYSAN
jgi:hypothetical protein